MWRTRYYVVLNLSACEIADENTQVHTPKNECRFGKHRFAGDKRQKIKNYPSLSTAKHTLSLSLSLSG